MLTQTSIVPVDSTNSIVSTRESRRSIQLTEAISEWLSEIPRKQTQEGYRNGMARTIKIAGFPWPITAQGVQQCKKIIAEQVNLGKMASSTAAQTFTAIGSFVNWCVVADVASIREKMLLDMTPSPKLPHVESEVHRFVPDHEVKAVWAIADDREKVILDLLINSALRVSELVGLKIGDISQTSDGYWLSIRASEAKFGKAATVAVKESTVKRIMSTHRQWGTLHPDSPVIPSFNGAAATRNHLVRQSINSIINKLCDRAGVPRFTTHSGRVTFATGALLDRGEDLEGVQNVLRHANKTTTLSYVKRRRTALQKQELARNTPSYGD